MMQRHNRFKLMVCVLTLVVVAGCKSIGPATVKRDRMHYATVVADSWKEQLLLNIVKTRYGDAPAFLEVASVVAGYSLETGVSLNGQATPSGLSGDTFGAGGVSARYTDRPTISYTPMTGERFAHSLLSPVPLDSLLFTIQGGAPADFLLRLTAQSFQGHYNQGIQGGQFEPGDASFTKLLQLIRAASQARAIEVEITKLADRVETWLRFHAVASTNTGGREAVAELKVLLGIPPAVDRVRVVYGKIAPEPEVIAIRTRSLLQILSTLGLGVQIPEEHLGKGGVVKVATSQSPGGFTVHSGKKKPEGVFVAVPYEGQWFWIDRDDLASKTTLSAVTLLFSFLDNSAKQSAPVLTIPTN